MRRWLYTAVALLAAAVAVLVPGSGQARASSGPTSTTLTVNGGLLTITTPDTANLGTVTVGAPNVSAALGAVTVSDQRAQLSGSWTASVISTAFTTGTGTTAETIPATDVSYTPGSATSTSGTGTFAPGAGGTLDTSRTAFTATAETGVTTCSWNPTVTVTLPAAVVAGGYSGTITHSVA